MAPPGELPSLRVDAVELRRVALALVEPFRTAQGATRVRDVLLVRVRTDRGDGWAECAATPRPDYTAEWTAGAHAVLREHLVPAVLGRAMGSAERARAWAAVVGHPMAKAALETAWLDAELRAAGVALADHLGASATSVPIGIALGIPASIDALVADACARVDEGYRRIKLKVRPGWDRDPVAAVRDAVGPDVALVADANGAYHLDDAPALAALDPYGLVAVEQPLAADRLLDHVVLAGRIGTPVCLDESIGSEADAEAAIALGACGAVCLKPARVGGLATARRVHDRVVAAGLDLWVGGMLETGVGRAALLAVAALPGCTHPGDVVLPGRWYRPDLVDDVGRPTGGAADPGAGRLAVPRAPGCGPPPDAAVLAATTTAVDELR